MQPWYPGVLTCRSIENPALIFIKFDTQVSFRISCISIVRYSGVVERGGGRYYL
jgi:hypothetical protein